MRVCLLLARFCFCIFAFRNSQNALLRLEMAAVARGGTPPTHLQFPRVCAALWCACAKAACAVLTLVCAEIVQKLREQKEEQKLEQKFDDAKINRIVEHLVDQEFESDEHLLYAVRNCQDEQSLVERLTQGGFKLAPASDLAAAILKLRPPAEPEPRLSPREPGMRCPSHI